MSARNMGILFDIFLVLLGVAIGIALVVLRTAQDTKRPDAEFTSERIEQ
jgi:hypothetical protein